MSDTLGLLLACLLIGLAWIALFYVTQGSLPVGALGDWNLVVPYPRRYGTTAR